MITKKDSGIKWIGKIPINWSTGRLKNSVLDSRNGLWGEEAKGNKLDYYCIRVADFDRDSLVVKNKQFTVRNIDTPDINSVLLKKGDLLIEKSGGGEKQPVGAVVQYTQSHPAIYANFIAKLAVNKRVASSHYLRYLHGTIYDQGLTRRSIKQTTGIQNLDLKSYLNEIVIYPPLDEQLTIADFLDQKTSEIDALIADKEKLIELLEEKRQAIITEAVTKGLDPNVKMKDSGVKWIGEIPKHWEISSLNLHLKESKTKNIGNKEKNVLSLSYGRIKRRNIKNNFGLLPESFETYRVVKNGDIVLRLTDLQNDKKSLRVGLVKEKGIITSAYLTLVPNQNILSEYASLLLHAYDLKKVFYGFGSGVRQSIGFQELKKLPILLPSKEEQNDICIYLKNFTDNIDETLIQLKEQITKLKEYRQALIYETVTGKIDVQEMLKETEQEEVSPS